MSKSCIAMLILGLIICGNNCGRSTEKSEVESKVKEEVKSLEKKVTGEVKNIEEDTKALKEEKDYEKALEEEPEPPAGGIKGAQTGALLGEEFDSPPE